MSETSDTSAIDEKKKESEPTDENLASNVTTFLQSVIAIFILIIIYVSFSGFMLYACKLAQSNILPTDIKCSPYTDEKPNIQNIDINIFTTSVDAKTLSMKMNFPYNADNDVAKYNSKNKILDMFRNYRKEPDSNFLANYLISIFESVIQNNYLIINTVLNMLNGLPEPLIILIGPILMMTLFVILLLFDQIYLIYSWFANMTWFFKTNTNDTDEGKPTWEDVNFTSFFNYGCAIGLVILFSIILFVAFPFVTIVAFILISWCIFSCGAYKSLLNDQTITSLNVIQDVFKNYKVTVMVVLSIFVVLLALKDLGGGAAIFAILTLVLIYFGVVSISIFSPIKMNETLSALTSYDKAERKKCFNKEKKNKDEGFFSFLGGGLNIKKELKNIHKKFYNKK